MILVVESDVGRKMLHKKSLKFVVVFFITHDPMAREDSFGIGIDDKDRLFSGVEQDGIGGFPTGPIDREQL